MRTYLFDPVLPRRGETASRLAITPGLELLGTHDLPAVAVLECRQAQPELVIAYLDPAGMEGPGLLAELRTACPQACLLAVADRWDDDFAALCRMAGADRLAPAESAAAVLRETLAPPAARGRRSSPRRKAPGRGQPGATRAARRPITDPELDTLVTLAARLCGLPIAAIALRESGGVHIAAGTGLDERREAGIRSACERMPDALASVAILVEPGDAPADPEVCAIRACVAAPLLDATGTALGALLVADVVPRTLSTGVLDDLAILARLTVSRLAHAWEIRALEASRSARLRAEREAREAAVMQEAMLSGIDGLLLEVTTPALALHHVSATAEAMLGYRLDWWHDQPGFWRDLIHEEDRERALADVLRCGEHGDSREVELRMTAADGEIVWLRGRMQRLAGDRGQRRVCLALLNVSDHRPAGGLAEATATRDELTGLPNRRVLKELLLQELADAGRRGDRVAFLFIDVDRFKLVNESLGHDAGDHLIVGLGGRLRAVLHGNDIVARIGDDEFAVVCSGLRVAEDVAHAAQRLLRAVSEPVRAGGQEFGISCSIGISVFPDDGRDPDELMHHAYVAMHTTKDHGGNGYRFYLPGMNARAVQRLALERDLRLALERQEFELHYQPQFDVRTGRLAGAEALLRWRHPHEGPVPPSRFVPVAEETGLIDGIGRWTLRTACRQLAQWRARGIELPRVSVNVSALQFRKGFLETVRGCLEECALPPACLELEVTESALVQDIDRAMESLAPLGQLGVRVAIDDFGTGYSSLASLRRLPVQVLKLDRSFVADLVTDPHAGSIVAAILAMSRSLQLVTIAEGVEHDNQLAVLRGMGCDAFQGFLRARAMSALEFEARFAAPQAVTP